MDNEYSDRLLRTTSAAAIEESSALHGTLHAAFDAIVQGDFDAFGAAITDDAELNIRGFGELDGSWRGRDAVIAATRKNFGMLDQQRPEIESIISQGDRIAVLLRERGVFKSNGQPYNVRGVQWFTFADGKIKNIDEIIAASPQ
jgi:ketosteroid isomerase-like protein